MTTLRKWFGPSREEIWRQLTAEVEGQYVPGTFWKGAKVEASHREWVITLDVELVHTGKVTIPFTRMRAPYVNPDNFRFSIDRKNIFTGLGKFFGMQDIAVGYREFDEAFVIKGNASAKVIALFQNARVRELLLALPEVHFSVKDSEGFFGRKYPENVDLLQFRVSGVIKDVARLKLLFDLFAETLDEMCRMGSAYENDPGVSV